MHQAYGYYRLARSHAQLADAVEIRIRQYAHERRYALLDLYHDPGQVGGPWSQYAALVDEIRRAGTGCRVIVANSHHLSHNLAEAVWLVQHLNEAGGMVEILNGHYARYLTQHQPLPDGLAVMPPAWDDLARSDGGRGQSSAGALRKGPEAGRRVSSSYPTTYA